MAKAPAGSGKQGGKPPIGRRFEKGKSGNPSGLPKAVAEVRRMAQEHGPEAIEGLLSLARGGKVPAAVRRQAWVDILARGYGTPTVGMPDEGGQQVERVVYSWGDETA